MAARKNKPEHDEKTKALIRASQLLNRLNSFAMGEIEMSPAQVNAAKIVIGKCVPDLKAIEVTGKDGGPIAITVTETELARRAAFLLRKAGDSPA